MPPTSQHGTPRLLICTDALVKCCGLYAHVKGCLQLKPTSQCCCTLQVQALVQPVPSAVGRGAANATLAAALSAGVFYAPSSPPPVPKRPDTEVTAFTLLGCCPFLKVCCLLVCTRVLCCISGMIACLWHAGLCSHIPACCDRVCSAFEFASRGCQVILSSTNQAWKKRIIQPSCGCSYILHCL